MNKPWVTLTFEGDIQRLLHTERVFFEVQGASAEEIGREAQRIANGRGIINLMCVAIHNKREAWVAIYGQPDGPCAFGDDS